MFLKKGGVIYLSALQSTNNLNKQHICINLTHANYSEKKER